MKGWQIFDGENLSNLQIQFRRCLIFLFSPAWLAAPAPDLSVLLIMDHQSKTEKKTKTPTYKGNSDIRKGCLFSFFKVQ